MWNKWHSSQASTCHVCMYIAHKSIEMRSIIYNASNPLVSFVKTAPHTYSKCHPKIYNYTIYLYVLASNSSAPIPGQNTKLYWELNVQSDIYQHYYA